MRNALKLAILSDVSSLYGNGSNDGGLSFLSLVLERVEGKPLRILYLRTSYVVCGVGLLEGRRLRL